MGDVRGPLEGFAALTFAGLAVRVAPGCGRFVLRCRGDVSVVGLPDTIGGVARGDFGTALKLGPDEWLLLGADADWGGALGGRAHALVDVGHRQMGIEVLGARAADVLNAGCPLDLRPAGFPVGRCARTVFGKTEIVLWRVEAERFRVEVARSFAAYAWGLLDQAARGMGPA